MFGKKVSTYLSPTQFLQEFASKRVVVGGIFANDECSEPELLIGRDPETGQYYIWENFAHSRRACVFLPLSVFEATPKALANSNFRTLSGARLSVSAVSSMVSAA